MSTLESSRENAEDVGEGMIGHVEHLAEGDDIVVPDDALTWGVD